MLKTGQPTVAVVDGDMFKYSCAFSGEKRYIVVEHPNGYNEKFDNRSKFWGRGKNKDGGELGRLNSKRDSPLIWDEFTVTDVQVPEPLPLVLSSTKNTIDKVLRESGCKSYKFLLGRGVSFRHEISTLLEYKGGRDNLLKPKLLEDVTDFIQNKYKAEVVEGFEADDAVVFETTKKKDYFIIAEDKDARGCPSKVYNPNAPQHGILDCDQFGKLVRLDSGKVFGYGRIWLYFQICSNDKADNYAANSFSDVKWGEVSAYNALKGCTNDREAFAAMKSIFKHLYPEPKTIIGWRGDEITIDWKYVYAEMFHMARMWRRKDDHVDPLEVMERMTGGLI